MERTVKELRDAFKATSLRIVAWWEGRALCQWPSSCGLTATHRLEASIDGVHYVCAEHAELAQVGGFYSVTIEEADALIAQNLMGPA